MTGGRGKAPSGRGQATRARLLDAAAQLVGEVGWGAVSTRLVAERAGVNPALVHYHFSSVAELLREAVMRTAREAVFQLVDVLSQATDVRAGVDTLFGFLRPYTGTDPASLLMVEGFLAATREETLRAEFAALIEEIRQRLADWLAACGHPEPVASAGVFAAMIDGLLLHRAVQPGMDFEAYQRTVTRMLSAGVPEERGRDE
ncbi:TetR family transcriptional regulator [Actinopolymorpha rutila]|uniref:AcrR family transcriptional regulator n=1 Tax=Actinopolymorpha rutila TaxID=446787 RepID=A0A852Z8A0_9ACTN|nr:AcrR family transcriptional regulator [Actinopolymorpha rutila]